MQDLTLYRENLPIVQQLSAHFPPKSLTAIMGPNGGGKSTFLEALANLLPSRHIRGSIDRGPFQPNLTGYLPQMCCANRSFPLSVRDIVAGGLWHEVGYFRPITQKHQERINDTLLQVGLQGYANHTLNQLSGGQFQRALFARLAIQEASFLLLDEPFTGIDTPTQADLLTLIQGWNKAGKTLVVVLHDADIAQQYFPRTLLLARNHHMIGSTREVLGTAFAQKIFSCAHQWKCS